MATLRDPRQEFPRPDIPGLDRVPHATVARELRAPDRHLPRQKPPNSPDESTFPPTTQTGLRVRYAKTPRYVRSHTWKNLERRAQRRLLLAVSQLLQGTAPSGVAVPRGPGLLPC